jgi:hypothetical protein
MALGICAVGPGQYSMFRKWCPILVLLAAGAAGTGQSLQHATIDLYHWILRRHHELIPARSGT